jgi:hypothetical protein
MLRLGQCEKAVTIAELMGHSCRTAGVPTGSKTPIGLGIPVRGSPSCGSSGSRLSTSFHPVFNDLRAEKARLGKSFGSPIQPIQEESVACIQGAQFGPNFVTIQPTGVCACSI